MRRLLIAVAFAAAALSCSTGPTSGEIVFDLATPNQDDGAIQFTVTAAAPQTLAQVSAACTGCRVFVTAVADTEMRGVLTGTVVPGPALRVLVSDRGKPALYMAVVNAAAARDFALQPTAGYTLTAGQ
jgi:hypothetical protein